MSTPTAAPTRAGRKALSSRWLILGSVLFALVLIRYGVDWVSEDGWSTIDLRVYHWGGTMARETDQLYFLKYENFLPFTYTPFAAATFLPLTLFAFWAVQAGMIVLNVIALIVTTAVSLRSLGYRLDKGSIGVVLAIAAVGAMLEPVDSTLHFGQINLILMAIVVADLLLPDDSRFKGIGVGIATGLKLTPAIFIPYLLLTRRYAAGVRAMITAAATVMIGFIVLPPESADFWFERLFMDSTRVGGVAYVSNQSVNAFVVRLTDATSGTTALWYPIAAVVAVVGFWIAVRVQRRGPELAGVLVCALTGLLVSPVSWSHHWVWLVPAGVLGFHVAFQRGTWQAWTALVAAAVLFSRPVWIIWRVPSTNDREFAWTVTETVQGNLYVLLGIAMLAYAWWWSTKTPVREPVEATAR